MAYRLDIANIVAAAFTRGAVKSSNSNGIAYSSTGEGELVQLISLLCLRSMLDSPLIALSLQILRLTRASDQVQQVRRQSIFSDFQKKLKEEIERCELLCITAFVSCIDLEKASQGINRTNVHMCTAVIPLSSSQ